MTEYLEDMLSALTAILIAGFIFDVIILIILGLLYLISEIL